MKPTRIVDRWFALHLTGGIGVASLLRPVDDLPTPLFVGAGVALAIAVVLSRYDPAFDSGSLWQVGLTTVGFVLLFKLGIAWFWMGGPVPEGALVVPAIGLATVLYVARGFVDGTAQSRIDRTGATARDRFASVRFGTKPEGDSTGCHKV